jgi:hypothetical protein
MKDRPRAIDLCCDDELGYERSRTRFFPGAGLQFDEAYRLAHLPLVAPNHPQVIPAREGSGYQMGRHTKVFSLVLPIAWETLRRSSAFLELDAEIRSSPFAVKIALDLLPRRQEKLHATICGSLSVDDDAPPLIDEDHRDQLSRLGPIEVEVRGLFSGNVNVGRLYLRIYPERREGANSFKRIQRILDRPETDLYLIGIYNFIDDLDPSEAVALDDMIRRWWDRPLLRFRADHLWLLSAMDDLVLDGAVEETLPLSRG